MLGHITGLFSSPNAEWGGIRNKLEAGTCKTTLLVFVLAVLPPLSGYIGTTQFGWQIGAGNPVKLTASSALIMAFGYYIAIVLGIFLMGAIIKWMGQTYVKSVTFQEAVALAAFVSVPLLLVGIFEIYPILWVNFLVGLLALGYSVYLLYSGLPVLLNISKEKGFLYASAIMGFGLVAMVGMLAVTALIWGIGFEPTFSS